MRLNSNIIESNLGTFRQLACQWLMIANFTLQQTLPIFLISQNIKFRMDAMIINAHKVDAVEHKSRSLMAKHSKSLCPALCDPLSATHSPVLEECMTRLDLDRKWLQTCEQCPGHARLRCSGYTPDTLLISSRDITGYQDCWLELQTNLREDWNFNTAKKSA